MGDAHHARYVSLTCCWVQKQGTQSCNLFFLCKLQPFKVKIKVRMVKI